MLLRQKLKRHVDNLFRIFFYTIFDRLTARKLELSLSRTEGLSLFFGSLAYREVKGTESKSRGLLAECLFLGWLAMILSGFIATQKSVEKFAPRRKRFATWGIL